MTHYCCDPQTVFPTIKSGAGHFSAYIGAAMLLIDLIVNQCRDIEDQDNGDDHHDR